MSHCPCMKNQTSEEKVSQARLLQFVRQYGTDGAAIMVTDAAACIQVASTSNKNRGNDNAARIQANTAAELYKLADALRLAFKGFAFPESPMPEPQAPPGR